MRETTLDRLRRGPYRRTLVTLCGLAARGARGLDRLVVGLSAAAGRAAR